MKWTAIALVALGAVLAGGPLAAQSSEPQRANPTFRLEPNIDRSGNDIQKVVLPETGSTADCERLCGDTRGCVAFTFVKRSTTVPKPICWLKDTIPAGYESSCCTSGVLLK